MWAFFVVDHRVINHQIKLLTQSTPCSPSYILCVHGEHCARVATQLKMGVNERRFPLTPRLNEVK